MGRDGWMAGLDGRNAAEALGPRGKQSIKVAYHHTVFGLGMRRQKSQVEQSPLHAVPPT